MAEYLCVLSALLLHEAQQFLGIAAIDSVLCFRREIQALDAPDGLADVQPGRRFERHIGSEHDVIDTEKFETAPRCGQGSEQRGVTVEFSEVVDGPALHGFSKSDIVGIGSARAE